MLYYVLEFTLGCLPHGSRWTPGQTAMGAARGTHMATTITAERRTFENGLMHGQYLYERVMCFPWIDKIGCRIGNGWRGTDGFWDERKMGPKWNELILALGFISYADFMILHKHTHIGTYDLGIHLHIMHCERFSKTRFYLLSAESLSFRGHPDKLEFREIYCF